MEPLASGAEFIISDYASWETFTTQIGDVIEVDLLTSSLAAPEEEWGAFIVTRVDLVSDGTLVLAVRLLGSTAPGITAQLTEKMGLGGGYLHLCRTDPCLGVEDEHVGFLHVNHLRRWSFSDFSAACDYLTAAQRKAAENLHKEAIGDVPEAAPKRQARRPAKPKDPKAPKKTPKAAPKGRGRGGEDAPPGAEAGAHRALSAEAKDRLRQRLYTLKKKALGESGGAMDAPSPPEEDLGDGHGEAGEVSDSAERSPELEEGDKLPPLEKNKPPLGIGDRLRPHYGLDGNERGKVTKDTTTKAVKDKLVQRALDLAAGETQKKKASKKKKKSSKKEDAVATLASSLQTLIAGKSSSRRDKARKKKRKRRTLPDGTIESWSESSASSSESDAEAAADSESDLETPVRKKSRDHPGSIVKMLTDHVRETLEQGATTAVSSEGNSVTSGVKVMTYFMLHLRPNYGNYLKEMREMHLLAAVLDTIRKAGDISRAADALAARFMAVHQSLLDQNWTTAKHMEIFPMQETSAVGPSLVLATRKHTRLVEKVQGSYQQGNWPTKGRGKGYRTEWQAFGENRQEGKGPKGRGKKGKQKGRGKGAWDWNSQGNEWKDTKEKPSEKTS